MNLSSELRIRTPEGIVFSYALAGPVTRCMAWGIDFLVIVVLILAFSRGLGMVGAFSRDIANALLIVGYFVISTGYGIVMEWGWRGRTVGKHVFGLRVADAQGFRLQFHQIFLRNLLRAVDSLPFCYLVGGLACLASRRAQRLGDIVASTVVVHNPKFDEPDLEQLLAGKYNSLREHPHLAARLRQRVSPDEARLALEALLRRERLDPAARISLFAELAAHLRQLVAFPGEAVESVSDEQYVRNVVDILFRSRAEIREREAQPVA